MRCEDTIIILSEIVFKMYDSNVEKSFKLH